MARCTETATPSQALDTIEKIEKEETGQDHSLGIADITAPATVTSTEATPDHNKGTGTAATEAAQGDPIQHTKATVTEPTMTQYTGHTTDHPHTAVQQVTTLRTTLDHVHAHPTDHQNIIPTTDHILTREPENHTLVGIKWSIEKNLHQITTAQMTIPNSQEKNWSL